jgi:transcriptional regulator with XRE-family HTH domain
MEVSHLARLSAVPAPEVTEGVGMGAGDDPSPVVQRRRLRTELRKARLDAALTQDQVAAAMDWSLSKVIRIEAGQVGISTNDLKALLSFYKITDTAHTDELIAVARAARERAWWSMYHDVASSALLDLIGYESAVAIRRNFEPLLIPGLLQTEEYTRALYRGVDDRIPAERVDTLVEIRLRRQELLDRINPPLLFFILDEATVRRSAGGEGVMRNQIRHLIDTAERPNVTIEVVPFSAGLHPGLRGSFAVLEFPDAGDDDVLYTEDPHGGVVSKEKQEDVVAYREIFEQLRRISLGPKGTIAFLGQVADDLA